MSLIKDQQRKRSGQTAPQIKPLPAVQPAPATSQLEEMQTPADATSTGALMQPNASAAPTDGMPEFGFVPESFPEIGSVDEPAPTPEAAAAPTPDQAVLDALDVSPAPLQEGVGMPPQTPSEQAILEGVGKFQPPTILADIGQEQGDSRIYAPEIITTKVPTVFNTLNTQSTHDLVKQGYAGINDAVGRRYAEQQAATAQSQQLLEDRSRLLNVPRVDKPWNASPAENSNNPFMDILFGKEQHRKEQPFKPNEGSYGKQGAGLLGGLNYLLNLPLNLSVGAAAEINEATANIFETFGVKREDAQNFARNGLLGLLPEKMRPSSLLGFDWKKARERNLIQDALTGDMVGDTNDPKGKNKGVYFSPRRSANVQSRKIADPKNPLSQIDQAYNDVVAVAQNDPIGTAIEVGVQLLNPGDIVMDTVWNAAWRKLAGKATPPVQKVPTPKQSQATKIQVTQAPSATKTTPSVSAPTPTPATKTIPQPNTGIRVQHGSATWEAPTGIKPVAPVTVTKVQTLSKTPPATLPTKSPRILIGENQVVQSALPPTIKPSAVAGVNMKELENTPAGTALKVGVGKPSDVPISVAPDITIKGIDDAPGGIGTALTDDLLDAAEELAAQKAIVQQPLKQLDDVFETTVDFGRKQIPDVPYAATTSDEVFRNIINGAKLNIPEQAYERIRLLIPEVVPLLKEADYDGLAYFSANRGISPRAISDMVANANNAALADVAVVVSNPAARFTIKMPPTLYHGTALADWTPNYNLRINGSRGELGAGLYMIDKPMIAKYYAGALMGENVPPGALTKDISPAVYNLGHQFQATLDARLKIPSNDPLLRQLLDDLPEELQRNVMRSLQRDKSSSYVSLWNKIEANIVRSGLEPTEETLRIVNNTVSENLRKLGYDSVYDAKSGFALALDETRVKVGSNTPVKVADHPMESVVQRYNADAYSAKHYPERVSSDANLRDSAAKLLNQTEDAIDNKLKRIQQEIIKRGHEPRDTVLPPREVFRKNAAEPKPATVEEALKDIEPRSNDICQP